MTHSPLFDHDALHASLTAHGIPGASIARVHRGEVQRIALGVTNVETRVPVDIDTVFQIGSITKIFTATLIRRLENTGYIEIDRPVRHYLPELRINHTPTPESLTVRTLLDYTSGIDGEYFEDFGEGDDALEKYVAACADLAFTHQPGELRSYNSTAYCIAGRIVEVVTGLPFNRALREQLLKPLQLERATFYDFETLRHKAAIGHTLISGEPTPAELLKLPACMSAAGSALTMTASDLLTFGQLHLDQGRLANGDVYVPEPSVADMQSARAILPPGEQEIVMGWAALETSEGRLIVGSGQSAGQNSFLFLLPEHDYACAILTNSEDGASNLTLTLGFEDLEHCTGAVVTIPEPSVPTTELPSDLSRYEGSFKNPTTMDFAAKGNQLEVTTSGVDSGSGETVSATSHMKPVGGHCFRTLVGGQPSGPVCEFLFLDGEEAPPTHLAIGGTRIFGRR